MSLIQLLLDSRQLDNTGRDNDANGSVSADDNTGRDSDANGDASADDDAGRDNEKGEL
jgi:hypothetical protein